jgi:hypothetical protein
MATVQVVLFLIITSLPHCPGAVDPLTMLVASILKNERLVLSTDSQGPEHCAM